MIQVTVHKQNGARFENIKILCFLNHSTGFVTIKVVFRKVADRAKA